MPIEIPTLLNNSKNKMIQLKLQNNKTIRGILQDFDIRQNRVLRDVEDISDANAVKIGKILLRGDSIITISVPED
jgi:small nuclear ribonucleoprotein (snRNP)-like protein